MSESETALSLTCVVEWTSSELSLDDVAAAMAQDQIQQKSAKYRSATGETWSGDGERPQWLKQAISAGQSVEHFAVDGAAHSTPAAGPKVDWQQDPFAGSRLATVSSSIQDGR